MGGRRRVFGLHVLPDFCNVQELEDKLVQGEAGRQSKDLPVIAVSALMRKLHLLNSDVEGFDRAEMVPSEALDNEEYIDDEANVWCPEFTGTNVIAAANRPRRTKYMSPRSLFPILSRI